MTSIPKTKAIELLQKQIDEIEALKSLAPTSEQFIRWENITTTTIQHIFPNNPTRSDEFGNISYAPSSYILDENTPRVFYSAFQNGLCRARGILQAIIGEIQTFWPDDASTVSKNETPPAANNKIFLVHGRDVAAQQSVARFLEHLGLPPIILSEQANGGRTLIEKFEQESDVGYAIILFTPDDIGGLKGATEEQARARQNVVFELGYFVGRLGRSHVCLLNVPEVEIPSDFSGVVYVPFNVTSEEWKMGLVRELKHAGFTVDANKAFS